MINIKRDILIRMNWIRKTDVTIKKKKIKFNVIKNKIFKWLKNLKKVFETIFKEKLSSYYKEIDYEITLKIDKIKSLSLIFTRSKKQYIIKEYLNEIIKKE